MRFGIEDAVVGVNCPPMHPNCRCNAISPRETDEEVQADIDRLLDGRSIEDIERELDRQIAEKEAEGNLQKQLTSTNNGVIIHNESEDFIFDDSKITGYMLCPGKEHYEEFVDVGYSKDDPQKLYDDIVSTFKKD